MEFQKKRKRDNSAASQQEGSTIRASYAHFTKVSLVKKYQEYSHPATPKASKHKVNVNDVNVTKRNNVSCTNFLKVAFQHPHDLTQIGLESYDQLPPVKTFRKWLSDPVILKCIQSNSVTDPLRKKQRPSQYPEIQSALLDYMKQTGETNFLHLREKALELAHGPHNPPKHFLDTVNTTTNGKSPPTTANVANPTLQKNTRLLQLPDPFTATSKFTASNSWLQKVIEKFKQQQQEQQQLSSTVILPGGVTMSVVSEEETRQGRRSNKKRCTNNDFARGNSMPISFPNPQQQQQQQQSERPRQPQLMPPNRLQDSTTSPTLLNGQPLTRNQQKPSTAPCTHNTTTTTTTTTTPTTIAKRRAEPSIISHKQAMNCLVHLSQYAKQVESSALTEAIAQATLVMAKIQNSQRKKRR